MNIRHLLVSYFAKVKHSYSTYVRFVCANPLVLIPIAAGYALCAIVISAGFTVLIIVLHEPNPPGASSTDYQILAFIIIFLPLSLILAGHYLYLIFRSFLAMGSLDGSGKSVVRVLQMVATTAVYFAVIHYYVALFSEPGAYAGLVQPIPKNGWQVGGWFEKISTVPTIEMVIDCLYFSAVTMATIGYGDIHPATIAAKIATMAEIFTSFGLIVVVLGRVMGRPNPKAADLSAETMRNTPSAAQPPLPPRQGPGIPARQRGRRSTG